jgi:hypothetical protein
VITLDTSRPLYAGTFLLGGIRVSIHIVSRFHPLLRTGEGYPAVTRSRKLVLFVCSEQVKVLAIIRGGTAIQMPKYIKDGAYTIVVDERSVSTKRTQSPKTVGSDSEDDLDEPLAHETRPDEQTGADDWALPEEELITEEEIDYTDTNFILQNLSIVTPNHDNDKTFLLPARTDLAQIIASQVRFYCYCAIDAFSRIPKVGTILVIGEGFIGARIINDLIDNGCREMLRICTRGDLTAAEWKTRGVKADNDLSALLDGVAPDIVILTVENASFAAICRQLTANFVVTPSTFIISCSFGFQRRKLYQQLNTPNIFRTFVEPDDIFSAYKRRTFASIRNFTSSGKEAPAQAPAPLARATMLPPGVTSKSEFNGTSFLATRALDVRNIIYQLENYYAIHHHGFSEARAKALKNVLGYVAPPLPGAIAPLPIIQPAVAVGAGRRISVDESFEQMSIRKAMKTEAKLKSKVDNCLKRLGGYDACLHTYQVYFAQLVTDRELRALTDQQFTYEQNNPKYGPPQGFERHRTPSKTVRKAVAEQPARPMYDEAFVEAIFRNDEDYSAFSGPGFELMATWDKKPDKEASPLKQLQQLSEDPANVAKVRVSATQRQFPQRRQPSSRPAELDAEAKREVEEFGRRLSNFVDTEATNIDRNYVQSYMMEANQGNRGGW